MLKRKAGEVVRILRRRDGELDDLASLGHLESEKRATLALEVDDAPEFGRSLRGIQQMEHRTFLTLGQQVLLRKRRDPFEPRLQIVGTECASNRCLFNFGVHVSSFGA